ncbi:MAG TPA: hypothetical protein ENN07_03605 [candidate division Zixibacteria bacterium]|nr:hypothetical protein [candidate division Zixibacteria bacterium]
MALLGIGLFAGLLVIALTIARDEAVRQWASSDVFEEAMEFASFRVEPHPIYPRKALLWIALLMVAVSFVLLFTTDMIFLVTGLLVIGMALFFVYDIAGERVPTEMTVLSHGLLFDSIGISQPRFFMPFENIVSVEESESKFTLVLKKPKLANRLPLKSRHIEEITQKIGEAMEKYSAE